MVAQAKIDAVSQYLHREFDGFEIADADDFERVSWKFRAAKGSTIHIVKFERRFWDDTTDVGKALQDMNLSEFVRGNEGKQVLVTTHGLTVLLFSPDKSDDTGCGP